MRPLDLLWHARTKLQFVIAAACGLSLLVIPGPASAISGFFQPADPQHVTFTLFASGYGSDKYGTTHEGFEIEQTITNQLGIVGRAVAYHVYQGTGFDSPLLPASRSSPRNFGRFQGGFDFIPAPGVSFVLLGGEGLGDSHAPVIEGDFSSWFLPHTLHPLNFSFGANHYYENEVTSGRIDLRVIAVSTADYMLVAGAGGAIWGGGSVGQAKGQGGPDFGVFLRSWHVSFDAQTGYGSSHYYGLLSFSKKIGWDE
jgi:hypothetical protein